MTSRTGISMGRLHQQRMDACGMWQRRQINSEAQATWDMVDRNPHKLQARGHTQRIRMSWGHLWISICYLVYWQNRIVLCFTVSHLPKLFSVRLSFVEMVNGQPSMLRNPHTKPLKVQNLENIRRIMIKYDTMNSRKQKFIMPFCLLGLV